MYRHRYNYWSCSALSQWILKVTGCVQKPSAATAQEWKKWHDDNSGKWGYWIAEEGLDHLQDVVMFVPDVYRNVKYYVKARFVTKPHYLDTKLKRGEYHEIDRRMLHGLFETLVDFVEVEKAHMEQISHPEQYKKRVKRSRHIGMKYLTWELSLTDDDGIPTYQATTADTIIQLYCWWKDERPTRPDPYGHIEHNRDNDLFDDFVDVERDKKLQEDYRLAGEIEEQQYAEDTEMLVSLIKIRQGLWT